jgi:hypothetical protein
MTRDRYFDLDVETVGCGRILEAGDVEGPGGRPPSPRGVARLREARA